MTTEAKSLVLRLFSRGVRFKVDGARLRYRPSPGLTPEDEASIARHKAEIIALLLAEKAGPPLGEPHPATASALDTPAQPPGGNPAEKPRVYTLLDDGDLEAVKRRGKDRLARTIAVRNSQDTDVTGLTSAHVVCTRCSRSAWLYLEVRTERGAVQICADCWTEDQRRMETSKRKTKQATSAKDGDGPLLPGLFG